MADYKRMYLAMFNAATSAISEMKNGDVAYAEYILKKAQAEAEDIFLDTEPDISAPQEIK